jgi:hypothetical protein
VDEARFAPERAQIVAAPTRRYEAPRHGVRAG